MEYIQPNHIYSRILDNIPWKSADPSVKGDPRKSVKWIDVRLQLSLIRMKGLFLFS